MHHVVIIGGGIAGLTAAYRLQTDAADKLSWQLIEAGPRLGGKIVTERTGGFTIEGGPDSVIAQKPWALDLMRELGLDDRLLPSNDSAGGVQVLRRGRLVPLPAGMLLLSPESWRKLFRSSLLPWPAKLRLALERWVPRRDADGDESVADFVRRRLGEGALWSLAEPVLAHVHAADIEMMSLEATYLKLAELERRYGSLHRGVAALRAAKTTTGPTFWTLKEGLAELADALARRLEPASLTTGRRATRLRRAGGGWTVSLDDGREVDAGAVVLATPAAAAAELFGDRDSNLAARLRAFRCASMATLSLGYRVDDVAAVARGFGFFVPRSERRALPAGAVLAGSWTSAKFDHRAPPDRALLRIFLGGAGGEAILELGDDALIRAVRDDLRAILGLAAEPVMTRLNRWPSGYPQYDVGHLERVREVERALPPGLFVAGSAYRGVGLPDCVKSGSEAARQILAKRRGPGPGDLGA